MHQVMRLTICNRDLPFFQNWTHGSSALSLKTKRIIFAVVPVLITIGFLVTMVMGIYTVAS